MMIGTWIMCMIVEKSGFLLVLPHLCENGANTHKPFKFFQANDSLTWYQNVVKDVSFEFDLMISFEFSLNMQASDTKNLPQQKLFLR